MAGFKVKVCSRESLARACQVWDTQYGIASEGQEGLRMFGLSGLKYTLSAGFSDHFGFSDQKRGRFWTTNI